MEEAFRNQEMLEVKQMQICSPRARPKSSNTLYQYCWIHNGLIWFGIKAYRDALYSWHNKISRICILNMLFIHQTLRFASWCCQLTQFNRLKWSNRMALEVQGGFRTQLDVYVYWSFVLRTQMSSSENVGRWIKNFKAKMLQQCESANLDYLKLKKNNTETPPTW